LDQNVSKTNREKKKKRKGGKRFVFFGAGAGSADRQKPKEKKKGAIRKQSCGLCPGRPERAHGGGDPGALLVIMDSFIAGRGFRRAWGIHMHK